MPNNGNTFLLNISILLTLALLTSVKAAELTLSFQAEPTDENSPINLTIGEPVKILLTLKKSSLLAIPLIPQNFELTNSTGIRVLPAEYSLKNPNMNKLNLLVSAGDKIKVNLLELFPLEKGLGRSVVSLNKPDNYTLSFKPKLLFNITTNAFVLIRDLESKPLIVCNDLTFILKPMKLELVHATMRKLESTLNNNETIDKSMLYYISTEKTAWNSGLLGQLLKSDTIEQENKFIILDNMPTETKIHNDLVKLYNNSKDRLFKSFLMHAIGKTGQPDSLNFLVNALKQEPEMRLAVIQALGKTSSQTALSALRNELNTIDANDVMLKAQIEAAIKNIQKNLRPIVGQP